MKIVHLTSVHARSDTRIFIKECCSLASKGFDVTLVVADGVGNEVRHGVDIVDVGAPSSRINRILVITRRVLDAAVAIDGDLYHIHDPELLPVGLRLKSFGKMVVFDAHEDVPKQLLTKPYLGRVSARVLSQCFEKLERYSCSRLDGIVAATPFIREKFIQINPNTVAINNFPIDAELVTENKAWESKGDEVCYIGGMSTIRGVREIVKSLEYVHPSVFLNLGGRFQEKKLEREVKAYRQWPRVIELGYLDREGVRKALGRSLAGLVTFYPVPNHVDAQPNKMFEYMAAGIPVIASDFPLWREIVGGSDCGICVDPLDPRAIGAAISYVVENPDRAEEMGRNGQRAVRDFYNWAAEEVKLFAFYQDIRGGDNGVLRR
ncbi:glycosyltransferase family 4 protein [Candidatus Accumulibacter sp. ACC007]|uniref:glycosyltransferase family 4 protein n=1 Tax=Candidatus Accumulibacter sp. ACC007 TaxID=2823333 RepID=UPI0025BA0865|nr:glycosyltransferase family 4 protein [Candidatus Accumulibacter sp. ACC007]